MAEQAPVTERRHTPGGTDSHGWWAKALIPPASLLVGLTVSSLFGAASAQASASTGPSYSFTTVSIPNETTTEVTAINSSGTYTGFACSSRCQDDQMFVSRNGTTTQFSIPFENIAAKSFAGSSGIDDAGEIVGFYTDAASVSHGFIRQSTGAMTEFDVPGAAQVQEGGTAIDGISSNGVAIVGEYSNASGVEQGFIDRHGKIVTYQEPAAGTTAGTGTQINFYANGEFGGSYTTRNGSTHGFYVLNGKAHSIDSPLLPHPAKDYGTAIYGVSSNGTLYGDVTRPGPATEGFSDRDGVFTNIVRPTPTATPNTFITNVNGAGTVVGDYASDTAGDRQGLILHPRR